MDLKLTGKTALVTGASRGIGLAVVHRLLAEGATVVGAARIITPELTDSGAVPVCADLRRGGDIDRLIDTASRCGGIDLLVNNAGGGDAMSLTAFDALDDDAWQDTFALNLFAAVRTTRAALPQLKRARGVVVNVSSIGAWQPQSPPLAYDVAKAALKAFGRGAAAELGPHGVRVLTVSPGPVRTRMWHQLAELTGIPADDVIAAVPAQLGMVTGRITEPAEVADLIAFLLSPLAGNITGSDHLIDGGAVRCA